MTDESSIIAVTDSTGAYIAHSNMEYVYLREHDPNYKDFQAFSDGQVRFVEIGIERMIPSVASIGSYNWNAIAYRSRKQLEKQIFYIAITIVIMSLISFDSSHFYFRKKDATDFKTQYLNLLLEHRLYLMVDIDMPLSEANIRK